MARKIILATAISFVVSVALCVSATDGYRTTTKTRGNYSFIFFKPSVSGGGTAEETVLSAMEEFEKNHPELHVTNWQVQCASNSPLVCYLGVWVHHEPKPYALPREGTPPKGKGFRP